MISDEFIINLFAMVFILLINIIGFTKVPFMSIIGLVGTLILAIPLIEAFDGFEMFAVILILVNVIIPFMSISGAIKGK